MEAMARGRKAAINSQSRESTQVHDMKDVTKQWILLATIFLGPVAMFIFVYLFMLAFNERILISDSPKTLRVWTETFARPNDLYTPVSEKTMKQTDNRWDVVIQPNHKYPGPYLVALLSSDGRFQRWRSEAEEAGVSYSIDCWSADNSFEDAGLVYGRLGTFDHETRERISGASLSSYRVPEDFGLDEKVTCRVAVTEDYKRDKALEAPFIRISRISQK